MQALELSDQDEAAFLQARPRRVMTALEPQPRPVSTLALTGGSQAAEAKWPASGGGQVWHNLPAESNSFVGRAKELANIQELLCTTRLLTLIGAGGVGKTRLALRAIRGVDLDPLLDELAGVPPHDHTAARCTPLPYACRPCKTNLAS